MTVDAENPPMGTIVKLVVATDAQYPESAAGDSPHCGTFIEKPTVGQSFWMDTNGGVFRTSFIKKIIEESDNRMRFETNNSVYQLTINLFEDID